MSPTEETTNEEIPSKGGQASRSSPTILEVGDSKTISARRFSKEDLHAINRELQAGPFDEVEWRVTDEQGTHKSTDLLAIVNGVLWESVTAFEVRGVRPQYKHGFADISVPWDHVWVRAGIGVNVSWDSAPERRQPIEFIYRKVLRLLEDLPPHRGSRSAFVTEAMREGTAQAEPEQRAQERAWWDPRRAPRSINDWVLISVIGGVAAGLILIIVTLILVAF